MRDCYLATRDAADITVDQHEVHDRYDRGRRLLEFEAGRRGFDLESGQHDPKAALDPERAMLHTDEDIQAIKVTRQDDQRQRIGH